MLKAFDGFPLIREKSPLCRVAGGSQLHSSNSPSATVLTKEDMGEQAGISHWTPPGPERYIHVSSEGDVYPGTKENVSGGHRLEDIQNRDQPSVEDSDNRGKPLAKGSNYC